MLRLDLAEEADRLLAESLGAKAAPTLVLVPAGTSAGTLATARRTRSGAGTR